MSEKDESILNQMLGGRERMFFGVAAAEEQEGEAASASELAA